MTTNIQLVAHARMALQQRWGYVYGTFGQILKEPLLQQKLKQYPGNVARFETFIRKNWMDKRVVDCVGLIKSALWWNNGNVKYTPSQDKSANGMLAVAVNSGHISTLPEVPGICVWKNDHIGIYIGGGQVIESRGTQQGVIQSPLTGPGSAGWTKWLECPYITYEPQPSVDKIKIHVDVKDTTVFVDGHLTSGTNYINIKGKSIALRDVAEALGLKIDWDAKNRQVLLR